MCLTKLYNYEYLYDSFLGDDCLKILFDYESLLIRQCETVCSVSEGKTVNSSQRIFDEICRRLTKDFLPPIDREDIAALSYSLVEIRIKCVEYYKLLKGKEPDLRIKRQLDFMPCIISGLLNKKKTCGDDIRRFIVINTENKSIADEISEQVNDSLSDFIKIAHSAFYKNL